MGRYRISRQARRDVKEISAYIAQDNPGAAQRLNSRFLVQFSLLADQPHIGAKCLLGKPGLRQFPVGNYVIYYRPVSGGIRVERVFHGARDQRQAFTDAGDSPADEDK